jgi:photosystem II stability/assembly factor-like uncharacterized protein
MRHHARVAYLLLLVAVTGWTLALGVGAGAHQRAAERAPAGSWRREHLPSHVGPLFGLACVPRGKRTQCIAVGARAVPHPTRYYHGIILRSENGGKHWTTRSAPSGIGPLAYLACPTASFCMADGAEVSSLRHAVITTTDGGARWVKDHIPSNLQRYAVSGPISCVRKECWIEGQDHTLLFTSDGGKHFSIQALPAAVCGGCEQTNVADVTFVNASDGYATGAAGSAGLSQRAFEGVIWVTTDGGLHWRLTSLGTQSMLAITCVNPSQCWVASDTVYMTVDGGAHWSRQVLPRFRGFLNDLRCTRAGSEDHCVAVGENVDETGPIIVSTADGGAHWSRDRAPKGVGPLEQAAFVGGRGRASGFENNAEGNGVILAP